MIKYPDEQTSAGSELPPSNISLADKIAYLNVISDSLPTVVIVHDMANGASVVYMSKLGQTILGFSLEDLQKLGEEYHDRFFNPDDRVHYYDKVISLMMSGDDDQVVSYFQQARRSPEVEWKWYLTSTRVFHRTEDGKVSHLISNATPIDKEHHITAKVDRLLAENNFLRNNQHIFASLSKREKEILRLMGSGHSAAEISEQLHIAESTANTHRRNIRSKLNAQSNYDIIFFAQAFNLL
ncbi:LuxR C-terminal-related transcriptional regulator [Pinibacter aurantiacus]|uniref:LuxR C-terminal-related transcriptional regulator n=1 Tax=Pinibacter aurantiacus TaxID=2851599 RepID=A0A9E2W837_9BACT|nr:LuxR C-terminal-related transcriptional regulator [Pinibacter aurantiacus]MBV4357482.1 LuxR C-terminal-related transcriptional regulator [Pinibacter aurantiacus]